MSPAPLSLEPALLPPSVLAEVPASIRFTLALGKALHRYGTPSFRLEEALSKVALRFGEEARFSAGPTGLFAAFGPPEALRTGLLRSEPGEMDLSRLGHLDILLQDVVAGREDAKSGFERLQQILISPAPYGPSFTLACYSAASASMACLMGGGLRETGLASFIGLMVGLFVLLSERVESLGRVVVPVTAVMASALAVLGASLFGPLSVQVATLGGLVVLLPGLSLTVSLNEIANRHLMSGTARLMGASLVFLQLGFGAALGGKLAVAFPPLAGALAGPYAPKWALSVALVTLTLTAGVLFRAQVRDLGWILLAGISAYAGARIGTVWLGTELGAFVGATFLGVVGNAVSRFRNRPAVMTLVPGLLPLVPGSVGLRSLESLFARDTLAGVDTAFQMLMVAVSLVAGLLLANALLPNRRPL